jgi:hypothetical protein
MMDDYISIIGHTGGLFSHRKVANIETMAPQLCSGRRRATQLPCDLAMSHDCRWRQPKHHHR